MNLLNHIQKICQRPKSQHLKKRTGLSSIMLLLLLSSCSWLDVRSKSEIEIDEMFKNKDGFYSSLTGVYNNMGQAELYGKNLPLYTMEPLTQQYTTSEYNLDRIQWAKFNYNTSLGETMVSQIWSNMYHTIVNCNIVIEELEKGSLAFFEDGVQPILHAEALALRSYMYFDLIRMFNDSYKVNSECKNVPYKDDFGFSLGRQISSKELLEQLTKDLKTAAEELKQYDPIVTGQKYTDKYVQYDRTKRMNYYAVIALLARIEIYRENYPEAFAYAQEVLNCDKFRYIKEDEIVKKDAYGAITQIDYLFTPEIIFGLYNENIISTSRTYYEVLNEDFVVSTNCYESGDVRQCWLYTNPSANNKINFIRYQRSTLQEDASKYPTSVVPMLKRSEMALIAAECALKQPSLGNPIEYLNALKESRNTTLLSDNAAEENIDKEITHEYICDFKGEGQLFYFYKRQNATSIDNGKYNGNKVTMSTAYYRFPLPKYEEDFGYGYK